MNNFIFNESTIPLYISDANSNEILSNNGDIFTINVSVTSLLLGDYNSISISNSINSKKTIYISNFTILTSASSLELLIDFIKNGTLSLGDTITPINNNCGLVKASVASVIYHNSEGIGTESIFSALQYQVSYSQDLNSMICIPAGSSILIRIKNIVLLSGSFKIIVTWYEV